MPELKRADARRNYARILAVATDEVTAHGAEASLEKIARTAGVGSATVRRHFPDRQALMYAVFRRRVDGLCDSARPLESHPDPRNALLRFLHEVLDYCVDARGFAITLAHSDTADDSATNNSCSQALEVAMNPLLRRAIDTGSVDDGVSTSDLVGIVVGIALATEHSVSPTKDAGHLFSLVVDGISPSG